jgi:hypothetical protein
MRPTGLATAALALLALTACSDGDPAASPTSAPVTTPPASTSAPATTPPATYPPGCTSPPPVPAGAVLATATISGKTVSTPNKEYATRIGSRFHLVITADVADEVHVHSYDRKADTKPGCPVVLDFQATIPGTVEVELEEAGLHLFDLKAQ